MDFKEAQFIYDNMSEEYPDEQECEQDYDNEGSTRNSEQIPR